MAEGERKLIGKVCVDVGRLIIADPMNAAAAVEAENAYAEGLPG